MVYGEENYNLKNLKFSSSKNSYSFQFRKKIFSISQTSSLYKYFAYYRILVMVMYLLTLHISIVDPSNQRRGPEICTDWAAIGPAQGREIQFQEKGWAESLPGRACFLQT